ncbi:interleukin-7 receptor subunit alpha [Parambassis ranga]|uniref:Interleukin-7 receptor subunit alpha n=1 Tax=Parambassis ranga TaxID=210632 RepID=A0A6P7J8S8_9TELE|nr:interleukin-7 receptor subunit alpha [Parambassis ranga]
MLIGWRLAVLLLATAAEAQSGDGDSDGEPRIRCTSDIMMSGSSLTCRLLEGGGGDDDDEDDDGIERMSVCYSDLADKSRIRCVEGSGDTVSSRHLLPLLDLNLTVHLKSGGNFSTAVSLEKIVRPRRPQVWNVTFDRENNQVVIYIRTPYHKDYLSVQNQEFQLHIFSARSDTTQNISSKDFLAVDIGHFQKHTEYHVRVRAIPQTFQGSWSAWSDTFSFFPPAGEEVPTTEDTQLPPYIRIVCLVSAVMMASSVVVVFWKKKIFSYMWPSIPHPKHTLVQICKPNKGLLLNLNPEVISALNVYPPQKTALEEPEPMIRPAAAADDQSSDPCSTQSSDCRSATSASTEELELSALLSRSSSDGEDSLQSATPSPVNVPRVMERPQTPPAEPPVRGNEAKAPGISPQEEAYVTMSSFYQLK